MPRTTETVQILAKLCEEFFAFLLLFFLGNFMVRLLILMHEEYVALNHIWVHTISYKFDYVYKKESFIKMQLASYEIFTMYCYFQDQRALHSWSQ